MISDMIRVRALRPADAWAPGNISSALFLLGANDAGEQWLERTRQVNPNSRYLVLATYDQFRVNKKYSTLTAFMRDTWMKEATEANYSRLGSALMLEGKPTESYEVLKESLQKHPYEPATGNISLSLDGALWLILAARAAGDEALANELLDKAGIQVRNAVEKRYYVLSSQASSAAYYAIAGERIRALFTLQQAAEKGFTAVNIECCGRGIRNPQAHVPLPLTATCQLCQASLKVERNTYIWPRLCDNSIFAFSYLIRLHQMPCNQV
jgi:tetratricopeptide (TPR) repeat protein